MNLHRSTDLRHNVSVEDGLHISTAVIAALTLDRAEQDTALAALKQQLAPRYGRAAALDIVIAYGTRAIQAR